MRFDEPSIDSLEVAAGQDVVVEELSGTCMELQVAIDQGNTNTFGFKLLCSPDCEEGRGNIDCAILCERISYIQTNYLWSRNSIPPSNSPAFSGNETAVNSVDLPRA